MKLTMPKPATRADSSVLSYRQKLPADIAEKARGRTVRIELPAFRAEPPHVVTITLGTHAKVSLRTRDPSCAKARAGSVTAQLQAAFDVMRHGPRRLSHREIVALSRRAYDALVQRFDDDPGSAARWARAVAVWDGKAGDDRAPFDDDVEVVFGEILDWIHDPLSTVPKEQFAYFMNEVSRSIRDASARLNRAADGDYTPDPAEQRFPKAKVSAITLGTLFDRWAAETKPAGSTLTTTRGIVASLDRHIGGCGIGAITAEQVVSWKDSLVSSGELSPRTVNDTYLAMTRALLNWAVANKLLKA